MTPESMTEEELISFVEKRMVLHGYKAADDFLIGIFHKKLIGVLLKEANISSNVVINTVPDNKLKKLV